MSGQSSDSLDVLFSPISIAGVEVRNRFVMPAMQRGFVENCTPTDGMIEYLRRRGEGGVGLIISEGTSPEHPSGYWQDTFSYLSQDRLGQWERLVNTVKRTGACFLLQLWMPGSIRQVKENSPFAIYDTISPSGLIQENRPNGRAITLEEMEEVTASHVRAAVDAKRIGADGVEIHCAHGYFLYQFLWNETNLRQDQYGGKTLAERARFPADIVRAVRRAVGPNFIISVRFSQFAEVDYGARIAQTPEDLGMMVREIRAAGADCINASSRRYYKPEWPDRDANLSIGGWVKSMTDAKVIAVGSVGLDSDMFEDLLDNKDPKSRAARDLEDVARRIERAEFDLIGIGRAQIANADFVNKARRGAFDELILFKKSLHLSEFFEGLEMGAVEKSRKIAADM